MTEPKQSSLDTVVTIYHAEGLTGQAAHEKLVKLAGNNSYTLEEVEALYQKINEDMHRKKLKVDSILDFPEPINMIIVQMLDISGRSALRKTCHAYREFVKGIPCHIKTLNIEVNHDYVKLSGDEDFAVTYRMWNREPKTFTVGRDCGKWRWKAEGDFFDEAMSDLQTILMYKELKIDELYVKEASIIGGYFQKFLDFLNSLEKKLKVKTLIADMDDLEEDSFCRLLQTLDVGTINTIRTAGSDLVASVLIHDVYKLEQWKAAKRFEGHDLDLNSDGFANISHFETCYLNLGDENVTVEHIMLLKDKLLLNPSLNQFKFRHGQLDRENIERLLIAILPFKSSPSSLWAYFNYPSSKEALALCVTDEYIWFKGPCYVDEPEFRRVVRIPFEKLMNDLQEGDGRNEDEEDG